MSAPAASPEAVNVAVVVLEEFPTNPDDSEVCIPVSYTHLTLPTILIV